MRHLSISELLALEGGEELTPQREHLASCSSCILERQRLRARRDRLRSLPVLHPRADRWGRVRAAALASRRRRRTALLTAAMAACILLVALLSISTRRLPATFERLDETAVLVTRSQALEERLRAVPEPEMLDVGSADAIVELEDEIAFIDQCIADLGESRSSRDALPVLWQARIELLETLLNLRSPALALVSL